MTKALLEQCLWVLLMEDSKQNKLGYKVFFLFCFFLLWLIFRHSKNKNALWTTQTIIRSK